MEAHITQLLTPSQLAQALAAWGAQADNSRLLGQLENFVYAIPENRILRITHTSHRTESQLQAPLNPFYIILNPVFSQIRIW